LAPEVRSERRPNKGSQRALKALEQAKTATEYGLRWFEQLRTRQNAENEASRNWMCEAARVAAASRAKLFPD
jgi:hypothetical protein